MSFIDVAIPGIIGLIAALWPQIVFRGSRATPDAKKIRLVRFAGVGLLVAALIFLVVRLAGA